MRVLLEHLWGAFAERLCGAPLRSAFLQRSAFLETQSVFAERLPRAPSQSAFEARLCRTLSKSAFAERFPGAPFLERIWGAHLRRLRGAPSRGAFPERLSEAKRLCGAPDQSFLERLSECLPASASEWYRPRNFPGASFWSAFAVRLRGAPLRSGFLARLRGVGGGAPAWGS